MTLLALTEPPNLQVTQSLSPSNPARGLLYLLLGLVSLVPS